MLHVIDQMATQKTRWHGNTILAYTDPTALLLPLYNETNDYYVLPDCANQTFQSQTSNLQNANGEFAG